MSNRPESFGSRRQGAGGSPVAADTRGRRLSWRLADELETERQNIARELHDDLGQLVSYLRIELASLKHAASDEERAVIFRDCDEALDRMSRSIHELTVDLRPPMLEGLGLGPSLRWLLNERLDGTPIRKDLSVSSPLPRLSPIKETIAFRVAEEALSNVVRHSGASTVCVSLKVEARHLVLTIEDDGVGFDAAAWRDQTASDQEELGLYGTQERLLRIQGGLTVDSVLGGGTRIVAQIPAERSRTAGGNE